MSQYPVPDITTEELEKELDVLEKNYMKVILLLSVSNEGKYHT